MIDIYTGVYAEDETSKLPVNQNSNKARKNTNQGQVGRKEGRVSYVRKNKTNQWFYDVVPVGMGSVELDGCDANGESNRCSIKMHEFKLPITDRFFPLEKGTLIYFTEQSGVCI